ncbi:MAG: phosphopyruvate hydratase [Terriglobia bacterium]
MKVQSISAYQVYDSRGNPTVEAQVVLADGALGKGIVPSGASKGQYEALELRDRDASRFQGNSVFRAIENIETILAPELIKRGDLSQRELDDCMIALDGTPAKSRLGANAILAVSMAFANATAASRKLPLHASLGEGTLLPLPEIQIVGGGAHADWQTDVQDFMIVATGAARYEDAMEITHNVYRSTRDLLRQRGKLRGVADEGGFWPEISSNEEAFELVLSGIECAGYIPGRDAALSLDISASDLYDEETRRYAFRSENRSFDSDEFGAFLLDWCGKYPVVSIEDPMAETDWEGWSRFRSAAPQHLQIIGDDVFTTNLERIRMGIAKNAANAVLIKLNQIGTVSETLDAIELTRSAGWLPVVSARSGETEDAFIAHLAVATDAGQLKVGSFSRSERLAKWNEVIRIGRNLGSRATFKGAAIFSEH